MKSQIHPKWYPDAKVTCACGNAFTIGAAVPEYQVEICSNCHPFYTGTMKFIDTAGRVDAFRAKAQKARTVVVSKNARRQAKRVERLKEELSRPESLEVLRAGKKAH